MKSTEQIPKGLNNVLKKYVQAHYPAEVELIMDAAQKYYASLSREFPDLGDKENMLAANKEIFLTFIAAYEGSRHRIDADAIDELLTLFLHKVRFVPLFVDFNRPWLARWMNKLYISYAQKVNQKKANGEWEAAWGIAINPDNRTEGCCFHLIGCPLAAFAKAHGYTELMPAICKIDHRTAALMHAKLIRTHTVALGADSCDYWYVGDESETARQYADLPEI